MDSVLEIQDCIPNPCAVYSRGRNGEGFVYVCSPFPAQTPPFPRISYRDNPGIPGIGKYQRQLTWKKRFYSRKLNLELLISEILNFLKHFFFFFIDEEKNYGYIVMGTVMCSAIKLNPFEM